MKPVASGAIAYAGSRFLLGQTGQIQLPGLGFVDQPLAMGAVVGAATLVSEVGGNYVLPYLPNNLQSAEKQKQIVEPALCAAGSVGFLYAFDRNEVDSMEKMGKVALLGAGKKTQHQQQ